MKPRDARRRTRVGTPCAEAFGFALAGLLAACVEPRGGWDQAVLEREQAALATRSGTRLGDLVPFPSFDFDRAPDVADGASIDLVACRFPAGAVVPIRASGAGWSAESGDRVLAAFSAAAARFDLDLVRRAEPPAAIEIVAQIGEGPTAPDGLGDTLVECDVERESGADGARRVRGTIARAEIRMRRTGLDAAGRLRSASDAEWSGALLHELAHALGFSGHAATGDSLLVREQSRLREHGRAVLRGEPIDDATLAAFHALAPGQRLGVRRLADASVFWLRAVGEADRAWRGEGAVRVGVVASAGDREARISLRYADGRALRLRFPGWAEGLRSGRPIVAVPDRETHDRLARRAAQALAVAPRLRARASSSPARSFSPSARSSVP